MSISCSATLLTLQGSSVFLRQSFAVRSCSCWVLMLKLRDRDVVRAYQNHSDAKDLNDRGIIAANDSRN